MQITDTITPDSQIEAEVMCIAAISLLPDVIVRHGGGRDRRVFRPRGSGPRDWTPGAPWSGIASYAIELPNPDLAPAPGEFDDPTGRLQTLHVAWQMHADEDGKPYVTLRIIPDPRDEDDGPNQILRGVDYITETDRYPLDCRNGRAIDVIVSDGVMTLDDYRAQGMDI